MTSRTTLRFRESYKNLPAQIRSSASKAYKVWQKDHKHPSLQFKKIHRTQPIYSVRISLAWRALGVKQGDTMIWFWIGSHAEYDKLIREL